MTVWIVLSIIAVVLSPLVWLRPSRSQSGRMAMRMQARRMGLAMQLIPQEWPHWLPTEPPSPCPQYHRPRTAREPDVWVYWQREPGVWVNQWREPCEDPRLLEQFTTLPADVHKGEAGKQLIALYWAERGEPDVLQHIAAVLKALA
jgi:ubiquinone biosynthesis protein Coq4